MAESDVDLEYLTVEDILTIHDVIVETSDETEPGVSSRGDVEYVVDFVREGHFDRIPETIHETAFQLLRLLVANHPFVDGNKRTALAATVTFYALNGYDLAYDSAVKELLKRLATDEATVGEDEGIAYLETHVTDLPVEYQATYQLWRDHIDGMTAPLEDENEGNSYDSENHTGR